MDYKKLEAVKKRHYNMLVRITRKSTKNFVKKDSASLKDIMDIEWYIYQEGLADTSVLWSEFCDGYLDLTLEMVEKIVLDDRKGIVSQ